MCICHLILSPCSHLHIVSFIPAQHCARPQRIFSFYPHSIVPALSASSPFYPHCIVHALSASSPFYPHNIVPTLGASLLYTCTASCPPSTGPPFSQCLSPALQRTQCTHSAAISTSGVRGTPRPCHTHDHLPLKPLLLPERRGEGASQRISC